MIGPLRPCIGIIITDGKKLIAFHKHSNNSLESMLKIVKSNLDLSDNKNVFAYIYTTLDAREWASNKRSLIHDNKTHTQVVDQIKDSLKTIEIPDSNIGVGRYSLLKNESGVKPENQQQKHADFSLGRYDLAETCVAVRMNDIFGKKESGEKKVKLFSIDPYTEDVFGYHGTKITESELRSAPTEQERKNTNPIYLTVPYNDIPLFYYQQTGNKDGYQMQRGICQRRMEQEERELYFKNYKISEQEVIDKNKYNSLDFFPL